MSLFGMISFLLFTGGVAVLSWLLSRGTADSSEGYFLGGRSLTAPVIAGSLLLTNLSTEQIVGLTGAAYTDGILVMAWETVAAIAMVFTAIVLLPRYLQRGISTVPSYLEERYDSQVRTITTLLFIGGYMIVFLPIVLYSGALALRDMFGVGDLLGVGPTAALWITVWALGLVGSVYAIFGGLKAVAISDTINAIGLFTGGLLVPIFGLMAIGDGSVIEGLSVLGAGNPEKFDAAGGPDASVPFGTIFTGILVVNFFYWGTNQAIIQRTFGAKNLAEGQKGLMLAGLLKILGPIIVVLPGIIAFHYFDGELESADTAYASLVNEVLPVAFRGVFAAVLFGAILSSFNSGLNSTVTLFGVDIYKQHINHDAGDADLVRAGKRFGILIALIAMIVAPFIANAPQGLFGYLQEMNGAWSTPILAIVLVGIFARSVPPLAAKVVLLVGTGLYILSQFVLSPLIGDGYPHYLHVMGAVFVLCVVIMLVIGHLRPMDQPYEHKDSEAVDMKPWKLAPVAGGGIVLIVVGLYVIFT